MEGTGIREKAFDVAAHTKSNGAPRVERGALEINANGLGQNLSRPF
jgi:hypothetical protein